MSEVKKLEPARFKGAEYERTAYVCTVENHVTREDLTEPSYWSHVAPKLRPWDKIEVRRDDGTYYAELIVLSSARTWAKVYVSAWHNLTSTDISQTEAEGNDLEFDLKYMGPHRRFAIIRKSDGAVIKDSIQTRDEAEFYRKEHIKTIA
jgi:hypothetical protein